MRTPAATMQSRSTQSAPISAPLRTTERSMVVPSPTLDALAEDDQRADVRAGRDRAAAVDERRRHDAPVDLHALAHGQVAGAQAVGHGRGDVALEDVERALQVALRSADVQPIGVGGVAEEPLADELRPDLALDRDVAIGRDEVEHLALEHVGAGGDELRVDLVGAGLLDELRDRLVVVQAHEAVRGGVADRHEREGADRPGRLVLGDLRGEVDVGEHVAVEHQEALVEKVLGVLERTRRPARLGLLDEAQAQPVLRAVAQHVAHRGGQEAARHDDVVDAVARQPLEHVGDERAVDERDDRLGHRRGQRPQARALAADEDHRLHVRPVTIARCPRRSARPPRRPRGRARCARR